MTYISAKIIPDLDGVACAIAYSEFLSQKGIPCKTLFADRINFEAKFVTDQLEIDAPIYTNEIINSDDKFIMVDFSQKFGLPEFIQPQNITEVIDHRESPAYETYPNAKWRVESVGAAATLIAEFYHFDKDTVIKPEVASLLLCAIYSNTVNFKSSNTTYRDHKMKTWLESICSDTNLPQKMFEFKSNYIVENLEKVLEEEIKIFENREAKKIIIYQLELSNPEKILNNAIEFSNRLRRLTPQAELFYLLIQDESKGVTSILSDDEYLPKKLTNKGYNFMMQNDYVSLDKLVMRKRLTPDLL